MPTLVEQMIPRRKLMLLLLENLVFTLVMLVGTSAPPFSTRSFFLFEPSRDLLLGVLTCVTIAIICQASLSYNDLYDWRTAQNRAELGNRLVHSCGYSLVMLAVLVLVAPGLFYFPGLEDVSGETWKLILLLGIAFALVYALRHGFHWFFYKWRFGERIVIVGASEEALKLGRLIQSRPMAGYELMGFVEEPGQPPLDRQNGDAPAIGRLDDLRGLCSEEGISRVVVALRERRGRLPVGQLLECRTDGVTVEEREAMYERLTGKLAVESMRPSYLIYGRGFTKDPLTMAMKRVIDIVTAGLGLLLSLPLCLLTALAVKCTSRGPVFFTQERTGQDGVPFKLVKFRTMNADAEKHSGPVWAQKNDSRITPIGKLLRLSRIDEIPQFVNILKGDMSFVGPRPERPVFVDQLTEEIPFYPLRHTVKPGLTGWAQVQHSYGASVDDAREKLRYDLYYIKNMTPLFDLTIILKTVAVILRGKGAR
ncbi:MAG: TIGR03013 family PEP-CTERM/XrtA system glycosyltransferase [bacterium]|nr:TIGR03013 family PEP-CTERM/XrtA system glycosyltransferase [bacterium]